MRTGLLHTQGAHQLDTQEFPHAVAVTTAEVSNRRGALQARRRSNAASAFLSKVQRLLAHASYVDKPCAQGVRDTLGQHVTVQIAKRSELHTFKVMPKRCIVERSTLVDE